MPLETNAGTSPELQEKIDATYAAVFHRLTDGSMNPEDLKALEKQFIEKRSISYSDIIGVTVARALANAPAETDNFI